MVDSVEVQFVDEMSDFQNEGKWYFSINDSKWEYRLHNFFGFK